MARKVFYSFHYAPDVWRVSQIRNIGAIEANKPATDNDWEEVKGGGDSKIKEWIDEQMVGKTCVIVLIGKDTYDRKYVKYEITKAWEKGIGLVGIYIHNLKDKDQKTSTKGNNPFDEFEVTINGTKKKLSSIVSAHDPVNNSTTSAYNSIQANMATWIEDAITLRKSY